MAETAVGKSSSSVFERRHFPFCLVAMDTLSEGERVVALMCVFMSRLHSVSVAFVKAA